MAHLDEDEKLAWMEDISAQIRATLADAAGRCEREGKCVGCVAQVIALALLDHAAWFTEVVASTSDDPTGMYAGMVRSFVGALNEAQGTAMRASVRPPRDRARGVH